MYTSISEQKRFQSNLSSLRNNGGRSWLVIRWNFYARGSTGTGCEGINDLRLIHFLFLAVDLCLDDRNILAGLVKRKADLPLLLINRHSIIHFELSHQIVNFDSEFLFTRLYLPFQKNNIGLME